MTDPIKVCIDGNDPQQLEKLSQLAQANARGAAQAMPRNVRQQLIRNSQLDPAVQLVNVSAMPDFKVTDNSGETLRVTGMKLLHVAWQLFLVECARAEAEVRKSPTINKVQQELRDYAEQFAKALGIDERISQEFDLESNCDEAPPPDVIAQFKKTIREALRDTAKKLAPNN